MSHTITEQQEAFALEYVRQGCVNATKAARVAVPDAPRPARLGMEWLQNPAVAGEIAAIVSRSIAEKRGTRVLSLGRKRTLLHDFAEDEQLEVKDRMKAIELDGKYAGDFAPEKMDIQGSLKLTGLFAEVARGDFELDEYGEKIVEAEVVTGEGVALAALLD